MDQGFSLTEVLVSLLLMTSTSLALFKQQWQVSQLFNQIHTRASALSQLDNAAERLHAGLGLATTVLPFKLRYTHTQQVVMRSEVVNVHSSRQITGEDQQLIDVKITWVVSSLLSQGCCTLTRKLVVDLFNE